MTSEEKLEVTQLLKQLINIESTNPPGNENKIANFIKNYLSKNKISAELVYLAKNRSSIVGRIDGVSKSNIALCGHIDTVRIDKNKWSKPPFDGIIENGKMYGRGTSDMKGGIAAILYSAILLKRNNIVPDKTIILALTADEEQKYSGAKKLLETGCFDETEFLIIAEPTDSKVYIGEKGELWIKAIFYGKAAHGSTPELGNNAITAGSKFVLHVRELSNKTFEKHSYFGKTSLNIGQFSGGVQVNIVPDYSEVRLDFRVISQEDKERAIDLVNIAGRKVADETNIKFESKIFNYHPPIFSDPSNFFISKFIQKTQVKQGGIISYCTDGATIIPKKQIPFVIYGPGTIALAHQPDEYVELNSLYKAVDNLAAFLIK